MFVNVVNLTSAEKIFNSKLSELKISSHVF